MSAEHDEEHIDLNFHGVGRYGLIGLVDRAAARRRAAGKGPAHAHANDAIIAVKRGATLRAQFGHVELTIDLELRP